MHATASLMERDEEDLLRRVRAGATELFYELIRPYQKAVYFSAFSVVGNSADAEDVAQEAFLKALSRIDQFRGEAKFSTWLVQITLNEARMRLRKERRNLYESIDAGTEQEDGDYVPRDFADWREIPTEALQQKELKEALARAVASLAPMYREVFVMRDVQRFSIADTARMLEISEGAVKTRLLRARFQMRDALAPGIDGSWITGREEYKKVRPW